jgi:mono/diheme cytochrome c family protein
LTTHRRIRTTATLATLLVVIGCATIDQLAPPVGALALREGETMGVNAQNLEQGRAIYITKCARCHSPEPVAGYTEAQWRETLPRMSHEAMLTAQETSDVRNYVMVTLRAMAGSTGEAAAPDPAPAGDDTRGP